MSSIVIGWHNEARNVVAQEYVSAWTWGEVIEAMRVSFDMMKLADKPAALVVNMSHPEATLVGHESAFAPYQKIRAMVPSNLKVIVAVGVAGALKILAETFTRAVSRRTIRVEFVDTLADVDRTLEKFYDKGI